jgi:hypothetical protein
MTRKQKLRLVGIGAKDLVPEINAALDQLTKAYNYARDILHFAKGGMENQYTLVPRWDRQNQVLYLGDQIVKHFAGPAPNQQAVLSAFQEKGWPPQIHNPIPPAPEQDQKIRLRDTIKSLNAHQKNRLIHFLGDGTGKGVRWELIDSGAAYVSTPMPRLWRA